MTENFSRQCVRVQIDEENYAFYPERKEPPSRLDQQKGSPEERMNALMCASGAHKGVHTIQRRPLWQRSSEAKHLGAVDETRVQGRLPCYPRLKILDRSLEQGFSTR